MRPRINAPTLCRLIKSKRNSNFWRARSPTTAKSSGLSADDSKALRRLDRRLVLEKARALPRNISSRWRASFGTSRRPFANRISNSERSSVALSFKSLSAQTRRTENGYHRVRNGVSSWVVGMLVCVRNRFCASPTKPAMTRFLAILLLLPFAVAIYHTAGCANRVAPMTLLKPSDFSYR